MEAKVNGVACELLDSVGRLIVSPNAMSVEGQTNTPVDLRENETLDAFLRRHVEGISSEGWAVALNGYEVKSEDWAVTYPSVGQVIAVRARVGKAALQLVAIAALTYFTFGFGTVAAGAGYVAGAIGTVGAMGVYIAGSILINKVLGPKVPKPGDVDQGATQFSLRDQRNQPRQYEPLPIVWGVVRVTPDLASKSYTTYEGNEQYIQMILLAGINVQNMDNLSIGDTALSQYEGVELYYDHVPAQEQKSIPIFTNADSIAGADLVNGDTAGIVRTTSVDTLTFQVDIEGQLYDIDNKGNTKTNSVSLKIESAVTGTDVWTTNVNTTLSNASTALVRRTYTVSVPKGQYDVRVSMGTPRWNEGGNADACKFAFQTLRSIQEDNADYSRFGRLGARIKASGQLTGSLDTVQADMTAKPMPIWTPTGWQTATTRENGLSNPGAVMLKALRGVYSDDGELLWGAGYPDEMIDIESYKSFMLYCTAKGFTYDKWVTADVTIGDFLDEVALAGLAEFSYVDGSRPSVVFVAADQPLSGVIGMANMAKGSFGVDYTLSNAADGIEYKYLDRNRNWELQTLRVAAPGKTTMLNPAQLTGEGVTTEAQAAMLARYHLAQSLYQYKTISYGSDLESLDYRRLSIVSLSHDMTQWGVSGRLLAISKDSNGIATVNLDMDVPPHATPYIGFRIHGERDYRVFEVSAVTEATDTITLAEPWPEDLPFPGEDGGMIYDVLWCYDFKETPGYRVRVVDMESEEEMVGAKVTCVPESPEFWTYVETGEYTPPPVQQVRPRDVAVISNLKVTEQTNIQGDTEWYEFTATWDIEGDYDHAQVWAGIDGSELRMVDGNAMGASSTFRIDTKGSWLIRVIPFNSRGQAGLAQALLYITVGVDLPPRNPSEFYVQLVEGSLRRLAWNYTQKPAAFAGVQIRYVPGDVPLSVADWDSMTPIGQPDDIYSGAFITTKPDAGTYSFGLRAVNTAGILSEGIVRTVATLDNVFDNILQPDLTPPPTPTGFEVATAFANAMLSTDAVNYTEGHGPDKTVFYVADINDTTPDPVFADARVAAEIAGTIGSAPVKLGAKYRWWAKWKSKDGVLSALPTTPIDTQVGLVGGSDLADDIITAEKLADGSVGAAKLAAGAVDSTKFANGIEPVTVVDKLPANLLTSAVSFNGKLYRWNGTEYTTAVRTSEITGQIVGSQIADGALNASKFASSIEPITLYTGAVPTNKSTTTISVDGKLYRWDGAKYTKSVPATDVTGQIVANQIADGVINAAKFASSIEPITLYTGAVPTTKSTSNISVDGRLYRWDGAKYIKDVAAVDIVGQITAPQIADNAVTATKLANSAVTANKIAAGVIDATKFAAGNEPVTVISGAVPTVKSTTVVSVNGTLYRWDGSKYVKSVAAVDIEGKITGSQIASSAIDATKLASGIEPVTVVSSLPSVKSTTLVSLNGIMYRWDGTKYTKEVPAVDITGQIADTQIAAGAITSAKIAANAVTAGKLAADAVTAGTIAAGAINARELAAGSVTTDKLVVKGQGGVINDDPALDDVANTWITGTGVDVQAYAAGTASTSKYFRAAASGSGKTAYTRRHVSIDPNKTYFLSASLYAAAGNNRRIYIFIQFYDAYGALLSTSWGATYSGHVYGGIPAAGTWTRYGDQIGAGSSKKIPVAARTALIGVLFQDNEGTSSVMQGAGDIRLELANDASLIVDGSIVANKIAANAITAGKIAANAVTAGTIAANAVTSDTIAANAVTTAKLVSGAVTADILAAGSVTSSKLVVTDTSAINIDPSFQDSSFWSEGYTATKVVTDGAVGPNVWYSLMRSYQVKNSNKFPIDPTKTYLFEYWVRKLADSAGTEFAVARFFDSAGNVITANLNAYWAIANTQSGNCYWPSPSHATPSGVWTRYAVTVGPEGTNKFPPGTAQCTLGAFFNYIEGRPNEATVEVQVNSLRITEMSRGELIVDGAITADKIAAKAITAGKLVVADYSTLVPDADYTEPTMWKHSGSGSHKIIQEASGLAGTLSRNVIQLFRGTDNWSGVISQTFSVTPGKQYVLRMMVWHPAAARILTRVTYIRSSDKVENRYVESDTNYASGWREMIVNAAPADAEGLMQVQVWLALSSAADFVLLGKARVQEAAEASLIVDGAILASKIAANAVTADKIEANAVTSVKIAANSVTSDKLTANSVIAGKIAANAITAAEIAAGAVSTEKLAAGAVTTRKLLVTDTSAVNIDPAFQDAEVWRNGLTNVKAITDGLTGPNVWYSTVETDWTNNANRFPIDTTKTYLFEFVVRKLGNSQNSEFACVRFFDSQGLLITNNINAYWPIAYAPSGQCYWPSTDTVTPAGVWTRYTVTVGPLGQNKFPPRAVQCALGGFFNYSSGRNTPPTEVQYNTIRVTEMARGELIVDGAITATKVSANAITAAKIAAGAVTAGKLAADSVTAGTIAAGAISTRELAANSVTTNKLVVASQGICLTDDPALEDWQNAWEAPSSVSVGYTAGGAAPTSRYFHVTSGTNNHVLTRRSVSIDPNKTYYLSASLYAAAGNDRNMYILAQFYDYNGNFVGTSWGGTFSGYTYGGKPTPEVWGRYGAQIGAGTDRPIPSNVRFVRVGVIMQYSVGTSNVMQGATDIRLEHANDANLIVDGAILARKIAANAITADKIEANAITADKIAANSITTSKVAAGAISADQLAVGAVTASKIVVANLGQALNQDPYISDAAIWTTPFSLYSSAGKLGVNVAASNVSTGVPTIGGKFTISPSKSYKASAAMWLNTDVTRHQWFFVRFYDAAGNTLRGAEGAGSWGGWNNNFYWASIPPDVKTTWVHVTSVFGAGTNLPIPSGAVAATVGMLLNDSGAAGYTEVGYYKVEERVDSELIVDGSITATKLAANSIVAGTAAIQNGAIVNAMIANATIDSAKIASLSATKITAGYMQVGSYIASNNFAWGSAGFIVEANGNAEFNNITARGNIYSSNGNIGGIRINGNGLNTGSYSGYAWPSGNGTGFHLGPSGLLLGNYSTGKYLELGSNGNVIAPGFRIQGGNAYFSGQLNIQSASSGARLVINNSQVLVYDGNNTLRVRLGIW